MKTIEGLFSEVVATRYRGGKGEADATWLYSRVILPFFGAARLDRIDAPLVERYFAGLRDRPYLHNRALSYWRVAWKSAERWGWMPRASDPSWGVQKCKERARERVLSDDELARFEAARRGRERYAHIRVRGSAVALRLMLLTGCRPGEILGLRWADVALDEGELRLVDAKAGPRVAVLPEPAVEALREWRRVRPDTGPYVFPTRTGGPPLGTVHKAFHAICREAGIEGVRVYDLRRSFGSYLLNSGVPIEAVSKLLGHTRTAVTERHYAHLRRETARRLSTPHLTALAELGG